MSPEQLPGDFSCADVDVMLSSMLFAQGLHSGCFFRAFPSNVAVFKLLATT